MRPVLTLTALYTALIGFILILDKAPAVAGWIAVVAAVILAVLYVRGPEPIFAWITGDHPDAKGPLDTEPENTP
jgi:hypothetical protein